MSQVEPTEPLCPVRQNHEQLRNQSHGWKAQSRNPESSFINFAINRLMIARKLVKFLKK